MTVYFFYNEKVLIIIEFNILILNKYFLKKIDVTYNYSFFIYEK